MHIGTDMCIGFSRSAHKYMMQLKKSTPNRPLHEHRYAARLREAHLFSAFAFQFEADFLHVYPEEEREYAAEHYPWQWHWYSPQDWLDDGYYSYQDAAKNLFYAKQVDRSYDILEDLDEDDRAM
ncbi:hypothetical protein PG994_014019 [Apiospora phragmitis]|uniref:Uncharacterized protein n=1 Tax=Apiospora phragmitis TaxID=2905665 RepID=A0ABR1T343_9PEZI